MELMVDDIDVDQQGQIVIFGGGVVVMVNYQIYIGNWVLFILCNVQGLLLFGVSVWLVEEEESGNLLGGMVVDGGQVYFSGVLQEGILVVSWIVNNQLQSCMLYFYFLDNLQQSLNMVKIVFGLCQIC